MRKLIIIVFLVLCTGPGTRAQGVSKDAATVNQYEGVYVFSDCKPAREYDYLGTVKPKGRGMDLLGANSNQYSDLRDRLIKAVKKEYPAADGLILNLKDGGVDKADVVKFK